MATRSLNKVQLIGNLTRDPELRYTPAGTAVCTLGLATNRSWTTEAGEKKEAAEFHRLVAWNKLAELCSQLLFKGRKVYVEGRLQTREWMTQEGQPRQTTEIVISDMLILDSRRQSEEGQVGAEGPSVQVGERRPVAEKPREAVQPASEPSEKAPGEEEVKPKKEEAKKAAQEEAVKAEEGEEKPEVGSEDIPF